MDSVEQLKAYKRVDNAPVCRQGRSTNSATWAFLNWECKNG